MTTKVKDGAMLVISEMLHWFLATSLKAASRTTFVTYVYINGLHECSSCEKTGLNA